MRILGLPIEYYEKHLLRELGNEIGRTLKVDMHSINEKKRMNNGLFNTERGQFARMCVEVDLRKTLVPKLHVRWIEYPVEYEGLSLICFDCGGFGHRTELCPYKSKPAANQENSATSGGHMAERETENTRSKTFMSGENFGPWMIAQRRKGCPRLAKEQGSADGAIRQDIQRDQGRDLNSINRNGRNQGNENHFDMLNDVMEEDSGIMGDMEESAPVVAATGDNVSNGGNRMILEGHKVINKNVRPSTDGPTPREQPKSHDQRVQGKKKVVNGGGSNTMGPNKGVDTRMGRSPDADTSCKVSNTSN